MDRITEPPIGRVSAAYMAMSKKNNSKNIAQSQ